MRAVLFVAAVAAIAGADSFRPVERQDWVADWDHYVDRQTTTVSGQILKFRSPAPAARREILTRADYDEQVAAGHRKAAAAVAKPPDLTSAAQLKLGPLEVRDFSVDDQRVRALAVSGEAVIVFWTTPQKKQSSIVYIQGRHPGHATVRLTLADGGARLLQVDVP